MARKLRNNQADFKAVGRFFMMGEGEGAEYKCRTPWLAEDEKLKKNHWLKHLKAVCQKTKFGQNYK